MPHLSLGSEQYWILQAAVGQADFQASGVCFRYISGFHGWNLHVLLVFDESLAESGAWSWGECSWLVPC